jgi:carbamoyltransferase
LQEAGIGFDQVDHFAIGRDPKAKFLKILFLARHPMGSFKVIGERLQNSKKAASIQNELALISGMPASSFTSKIHQIEHHRSHIASAFFASPFKSSLLIYRWQW